MNNKLLIKNFKIVSFRYGSRLQNGPEWAYKIVYHAPDGRSVELNHVCFTKAAAKMYIRETINVAKELLKQKEKEK